MISWQVHYHAQWVFLFWQHMTLKNVAGMANLNKSPRVYPVFGTFRGTNPPALILDPCSDTHQAL